MDRAIRRMWMSAACVFVLLMGTLSYIQFFDSKTLMANPWNSRALYDNYGSARGSIVVDGTEIASSVKSDDEYNYQRVQPPAQVRGSDRLLLHHLRCDRPGSRHG